LCFDGFIVAPVKKNCNRVFFFVQPAKAGMPLLQHPRFFRYLVFQAFTAAATR
jgi:hypothetical protein